MTIGLTSNIVVLSKTGVTPIQVHAQKVEEDIQNSLIKVPLPVTKSKQDTVSEPVPDTMIIDLKRYNYSLDIQGYLYATSTDDVMTVKDNLVNTILNTRGDINVTWRSSSFTAGFNKVKFIDAQDVREASGTGTGSKPARLGIQLNLIRGTIR